MTPTGPGRRDRTPHSAVVAIPPKDGWPPIQALRELHDAYVGRWMPHITLLYPFLPAERFAEAEPKLRTACQDMAPFRLKLARFGYFAGPRTVWLDTEPDDAVQQLQRRLQSEFPALDDVTRFPGGFRPHLTIGQGPPELADTLQAAWKPMEIEIREVCLIRRTGPDAPFRVHRTFSLGR